MSDIPEGFVPDAPAGGAVPDGFVADSDVNAARQAAALATYKPEDFKGTRFADVSPEYKRAALDAMKQHSARLERELGANNPALVEAMRNPETPGIGERASASFPVSADGKLQQIVGHYGRDNVKVVGNQLLVREGPDKQWMEFNKPGLHAEDIGALAGPAVENIPAGIGAAVGGAAGAVGGPAGSALGASVGSGVGGVVGNLVRQGIGAIDGERLPAGERAKEAAKSGAWAAGTELGLQGIGAGMRYASPTSRISRIVQGGAKEAAEESGADVAANRALGREFGAPMSAADVTQSSRVAQLEALQKMGPSSEVSKSLAIKKADAVAAAREDIVKDIAMGKSTSPGDAAQSVINSVNTERDLRWQNRIDNARTNFAAIDEAAGGQPSLPTNALILALKKEAQRFSGPGMPASGQEAFLEKTLARLYDKDGKPVLLTGQQYSDALHGWGQRMSEGSLHKNLDIADSQMLAKEMFGALQEDLDSAIGGAGSEGRQSVVRGKVADAVRSARDVYRGDTESIAQLDKDQIIAQAKRAGGFGSPETLVNGLASGAKSPTQIAASLKIIDQFAPKEAQALRGSVVEEMLSPKRVGEESTDRLLSALSDRNNQRTLQAMFVTQPEVFDKLMRLRQLTELYHRANVLRGSPTEPRESIRGTFEKFIPAGIGEVVDNALEKAGLAKKVLTNSKAAARLLSTPEGVDVALGLAQRSTLWNPARKGASVMGNEIARLGARAVQLAYTSNEAQEAAR